jgi:hypothetical protein
MMINNRKLQTPTCSGRRSSASLCLGYDSPPARLFSEADIVQPPICPSQFFHLLLGDGLGGEAIMMEEEVMVVD